MSAPAAAGLAAACAALLSALVLRIARAMPFRWIGARALLRSSVGGALLTFVLAAFAIPVASLLGLGDRVALDAGAVAGFLVGSTFVVLVALGRRDERAALRLIEILPTSHEPANVQTALARRLARLRAASLAPGDARLLALEVASVRAMRLAGLLGPCGELADAIDASALAAPLREALLYDRALLRLREGSYEAAEPLLDDAQTGPRVALRALSHALQGGADQAIALLEQEIQSEPEPRLLAGVARGHALASMGLDDESRRIVTALISEHGMTALAHLLRPVGPATDLARSMVGRAERPEEAPR